MTDKPELPEDVQVLLSDMDIGDPLDGAGPAGEWPADNVTHIGAKFDRPALKVVPINANAEQWRDVVATLRELADDIESGKESAVIRSTFIAQREDGALDIYGIGPLADDMSVLALIGLGLHQMQSEMLY